MIPSPAHQEPTPPTVPVDNPSRPVVSVVIPVYNGGLQISRCLEALAWSDYRDFETIVVDDCSTDNTEQIVKRHQVRCYRTPRCMGPAAARNLGVSHARGSIIFFVDADVVVPPQAIRLVVEEFARNPVVAAVFGSYDEHPAWLNFLSQYKNLMHRYVHQDSDERATTFWAGCGAIRRKVFDEIGGFDFRRYSRPSIEDIELGYRIIRAGGEIRLNKRLEARHLKKWTLRSLLQADIFQRAVPWTMLILETRNLPRSLNLTYKARLSTVLVGLGLLTAAALPLQAAIPAARSSFGPTLGLEALTTMVLLFLNWPVYRYFREKRGWSFMARVVPVHWLYYFYSGSVFLICSILRVIQQVLGIRAPMLKSSAAQSETTGS